MKKITKRANGTTKVQTVNTLPSVTQKQWKNDVDVNKIMARYKKTGMITHLRNAEQGAYLDLTELPDLLTAQIQLKQANEKFLEIPPQVRLKFNNDPNQLISYLQNPSNHEEAIHLGLMVKRDEPNPKPNDATPPKAPEASSPLKS